MDAVAHVHRSDPFGHIYDRQIVLLALYTWCNYWRNDTLYKVRVTLLDNCIHLQRYRYRDIDRNEKPFDSLNMSRKVCQNRYIYRCHLVSSCFLCHKILSQQNAVWWLWRLWWLRWILRWILWCSSWDKRWSHFVMKWWSQRDEPSIKPTWLSPTSNENPRTPCKNGKCVREKASRTIFSKISNKRVDGAFSSPMTGLSRGKHMSSSPRLPLLFPVPPPDTPLPNFFIGFSTQDYHLLFTSVSQECLFLMTRIVALRQRLLKAQGIAQGIRWPYVNR